MKEALCQAFCGDLTLTEVPVGFAVSTTFTSDNGDAIGFYLVRDANRAGVFRIEDDGTTVASLEASGVDFSTAGRAQAFDTLIENHGVEFDEDEMLLHTKPLREAELPGAAMRFVSMMLRMGDFLLLTKDKVASTFKEDATARIRERLGQRAEVSESVPVSAALADTAPDVLIRAPGRRPVAVFLGTSPQRIYEALMLQMQALYEAQEDIAVVALLENDAVINRELRRRASNRLTALPTYRGDEAASIGRIELEAIGGAGTLH